MTNLVTTTLQPGSQLYKYHLLTQIGQGTFGEVWLAIDRAINREYAIKILNPGLTVDERLKEARIGNLINHNNLVRVHQADVVNVHGNEVVILAMDYLPTGSIERMANPAGFLPLPEVLRIGKDILQGLDYLHANHFFHNDIKPGNILVGPQGQGMLSDFGITCVSVDGSPVSAPDSYLLHRSPEVLHTGNAGVSTDIFQTGMTLLRMLAGMTLLSSKKANMSWDEYAQATCSGALVTEKDFHDHTPSVVKRIVLKAINPNPENRFKSTLEMRRQLEKLNFPGYWSVDEAGQEFGQNDSSRYTYDIEPSSGAMCSLNCFKTSLATGRTQRVTRFCRKSLTRKAAAGEVKKFKKHVILGS